MANEITPEVIAQWMVDELERRRNLYQEDAAAGIDREFGGEFTYLNENGNPAVDKRVLKAFKKLTSESVVWERGERCWRKRAPGDAPGRQQE